ncbi:MAG: hypothetical protein ACRD03_06460, partial [Acidimicrobiales bacterium]
LLGEVMRHGRRTAAGRVGLDDASRHFEQEWAGLAPGLKHLGAPARHPVSASARLRELAEALDERHPEEVP